MALIPTSGNNQVFYNDVTNQYHLVRIAPSDGTKTDLGVIAQTDQLTAIASLETQVDLATIQINKLNPTEVRLGNVTGYAIMEAMGERIGVGTTATGEDITRINDLSATPASPASHTVIPMPADAGEQMTLISESDADNGATATGALTVTLEYLDATGVEQTETVTMNGQAQVNTTATDIRFLNDMYVATVGSGTIAAGHIRVYKTGSNTLVYNMIAEGGNKSLVPHRMVPLGKTLYLQEWHSEEAQGKRINVRIRANATPAGVLNNNAFLFKDVAFVKQSASGLLPLRAMPIPSLAVVKVSGWAIVSAGEVGCGWWGYLVDD